MLQVIFKQLGFLNHILPQLSFSMIFKAISNDFSPDSIHMFIVKKNWKIENERMKKIRVSYNHTNQWQCSHLFIISHFSMYTHIQSYCTYCFVPFITHNTALKVSDFIKCSSKVWMFSIHCYYLTTNCPSQCPPVSYANSIAQLLRPNIMDSSMTFFFHNPHLIIKTF